MISYLNSLYHDLPYHFPDDSLPDPCLEMPCAFGAPFGPRLSRGDEDPS